MPVLRRGRVVRFPRERLLAWLERQEPGSRTPFSALTAKGRGAGRVARNSGLQFVPTIRLDSGPPITAARLSSW
jgi:hypothetical protein